MAAEQILQTKQTDNEVHRLLIKKCDNIEDKINELRGLISTINFVFSGESLIGDENDITDLFFATRVIKEKFNELMKIMGYGLNRD